MRKIMMALPIVGLLLTGSAPSIPITRYGNVYKVIKADAYNSPGIHMPCVIGSTQQTPLTFDCQVDTGDAVPLPYILVGPMTWRFIGGMPGKHMVGLSGINGIAKPLPTEHATLTIAGTTFKVLLVRSKTQTLPLVGTAILQRISQAFEVDWKTGEIKFYGKAGKVSNVWRANNNS